MTISDYYENKILDHMLRNQAFSPPATVYVSLHTANPGEDGASEVTGGSYARQSVSFNAAAAGLIDNDAVIEFIDMPAETVTHAGIWDAASGGNFLWGGALSVPKSMNAGDTFRFPAGDLDVTAN